MAKKTKKEIMNFFEKTGGDQSWLDTEFEEGQLSLDVYQTAESLIIKSTIAGTKPEDVEVSINNDMLTIRGQRDMQEEVEANDYLYKECYWGKFSRSIILPVEIKPEQIKASLKNGVLTIILPKVKKDKKLTIKIQR